MATNINEAFQEFLGKVVRVSSTEAKAAKDSRNWLVTQLNRLADEDGEFPKAYKGMEFFYGSFSRGTKIVEVDDIDLLFTLHAHASTYAHTGGAVELTVAEKSPLLPLCDSGTTRLNSRMVINAMIRDLKSVPQYGKAEFKRNGAAAVLSLSSYPWVFDIVPAFFTKPDYSGRTYFLIPDGNGAWKKTDPRIDHDRIVAVNSANDGNALDLIRLAKFWNKRETMPTMSSYLLECIALSYIEHRMDKLSSWPDLHFGDFLKYLAVAVYLPVPDPKGLEGDLNLLEGEERSKVSAVASRDLQRAAEARQAESSDDHATSIRKWREVFGADFPQFG